LFNQGSRDDTREEHAMPTVSKITPCLWFDTEGEEAARFYVSIFPNSKIGQITHYGAAGQEFHGRPVGSVLTVAFELDGQAFTVLNGGPNFKFSEAISFQVTCDTQAEVDAYWEKLGAGGDPQAQQCGWLKDKYGVSWQIVPRRFMEMINDHTCEKSQRAMGAMMHMRKLDIAALERAYEG
jgi:predicted 3-demethylubiquinone-9 3-methyltransferase (glyoxalase superfamily)